jgi:fatty-acyl-CoA synthase
VCYGLYVVTDITPADNKFARNAWLRALSATAEIDRNPLVTLPVLVEQWALRSEAADALVSPGATLTYRALAARSHQYARWGLAQGFKSGDVVSLCMANCAEYVAIWLGLTRLGVTVALANTHLVGDALAHCLTIVSPRCIIVGAEHAAGGSRALQVAGALLGVWIIVARDGAAGTHARRAALEYVGA